MSTTEAPAPLSVPLTVLQCGTCRNCRWWRVKSDDEEGREWSICDNAANIEQVKATGQNTMRRLLTRYAGYTHEAAQEMADLIETRFREDFGCLNWQGREV